jgi:transposase
MTEVKSLDFSGQSIFCGIDVHKKSWSVCLRNEERELKTFSQDPNPLSLSRHLKRYYPNAQISIVYEAGFCGYWPQQVLTNEGLNCRIIHPADVPQTDKHRRYKTDAVDCRKLATELSKGTLNFIHIPSELTIACRTLVRGRQALVKDQTRYKNRIQSFLDMHGIIVPDGYKKGTHFSNHLMQWMQNLPLDQKRKLALSSQLTMLTTVRLQILTINKELRKLTQDPLYSNQIELLRSIPGIGILSAFIIMSELEDIHRFRGFDQLASYVGFKPDIYASGEKQVTKGITHSCNHILRETLVECAWMAIGKDPALTMAYTNYKQRMHYNKAILRIAKKVLNRIRYVLLNSKPYEIGIVE